MRDRPSRAERPAAPKQARIPSEDLPTYPSGERLKQRGAALLTAMIIVTLVTTLATSMVWQQWRAVQVETAERARTQSAWILSGALDWARLILREDARTAQNVDHLGEPWAVPLAEARLSTFLAADREATDDAPEAFLSGWIVDAQARYNLRNLVDDQGKVIARERETLRRLCEVAGVADDVAVRLATALGDAIARETGRPAPATAPLLPRSVAQLAWLGVDADTLARLAPYVVLLPERTPLNLNTAAREVVAAVAGVDLGNAERLVQTRQRTPLNSVADAARQLQLSSSADLAARAGTATRYFEVHGRLRLADRVLEQRSLLRRDKSGVTPVRRERTSLQAAG
jgi:general secretion pathway protein K